MTHTETSPPEPRWTRYRKAIAAGCGFVATALTGVLAIADVVPEPAVKYVMAVVSVLTLASVYQVPNARAAGRLVRPRA